MTRREYVAGNTERLAKLLGLAQSDGLAANGCSLYILLPMTDMKDWESWLEEEYPPEWDNYDRDAEIDEMCRAVDEAAMEALARKRENEEG